MLDLAAAAKWIPKLASLLKESNSDRKSSALALAEELGISPKELASTFVEPLLQQFNPVDIGTGGDELFQVPFFKFIDGFIRRKISNGGRSQLFILADAGMGKTSVLAMLKLAHINSFFPKDYNCVALKLGENTLERIENISEKYNTLLLLDSIDEDPLAIGRTKARIIEILDATQPFFRVIITCRTQFFPITEETTFQRQDRIQIGEYNCPIKYLSLFNDEQVDAYLKKRCLDNKEIASTAKKITTKMQDLRFRPLVLSYINDLVDAIDIDNPYLIYGEIVNAWLRRECRKDRLTISSNDLQHICQKISRFMAKKGVRKITEKQIYDLVENSVDYDNVKQLNIGGRSLLNRNSDGYYLFSHQTFQDFFVVQSLVENFGWDFRSSTGLMDTFISFSAHFISHFSRFYDM